MKKQSRLFNNFLVSIVFLSFFAMCLPAIAQDPIEIFADKVEGVSPGDQDVGVPIYANNIPQPPAEWYDGNGDFDDAAYQAWLEEPQNDPATVAVFSIEFTVVYDPGILSPVMVDVDTDGDDNPDMQLPKLEVGWDLPTDDVGNPDWTREVSNPEGSGDPNYGGWEQIKVALAGSMPIKNLAPAIAEIFFNVTEAQNFPDNDQDGEPDLPYCTEVIVRNSDGNFEGRINEGQFNVVPRNYDADDDPDIGQVCVIGTICPFEFKTSDTVCNFWGTVQVLLPDDTNQFVDAEPGDCIGVFVDSVETNDGCIGVYEVGTVGEYGLLAAYGDDTTTPEKDGAVADDTVSFKIWDKSEDEVFDAEVISGDNSWTSGVSKEVDIRALPPVPPVFKLHLAEGWNCISWTVAKCFYQDSEPSDPLPQGTQMVNIADLGFTYMSEWFSSIVEPNNQVADAWRIVIGALPGGAAKTIDSTVPARFHTLKFMGPGYGYWVKLNEGTGGGTITLEGENIAADAEITLADGWNLPGYLPTVCYYDSDSAPTDDLLYVKRTDSPPYPTQDVSVAAPVTNHVLNSIDGQWRIVIGARPGGSAITADPTVPERFWSLHDFCPGNGYWVKIYDGTGGAGLVYPVLNNTSSQNIASAPKIEYNPHSSKVVPTNTSMFIYGKIVNEDGIPAPVGSEILVRTSSGILCGEGKIERPGEYNLLPIYGDDLTTEEVDGALLGDKLEIYVNGTLTESYKPVRWLGDRTVKPVDLAIRRIPKNTSIGQNYPNPFNPETWIPYALSEAKDVNIKIYNLNGQLIRNIDLGQKKAGIYHTKDRAAYWDGKNESGERVSSGLYFYELNAGEFRQVKRMVIIK